MSDTTANLKAEILSQISESYDLSYKIIIVGDSGVGKSSLTLKGTRKYLDFEEYYSPTVGFEFSTLFIKVEDRVLKLQIWDTCGQENYRSLINNFYRNASLVMILYDTNMKESFKNLNEWINQIRDNSNPDIKIFLIGTKVDLTEKREVSEKEAEKFVESFKIDYFKETSAKTGFQVEKVFLEAGKVLYLEYLSVKNLESRISSFYDSNNDSLLLKEEFERENKKSKNKKMFCC